MKPSRNIYQPVTLSGVAQRALMRMSDKRTGSLPLMDAEDVVMRELFVAALDLHASKRRYSVETPMGVWTDEIESPDLDQTLAFVGIARSGTMPTLTLYRWALSQEFTACQYRPLTGERKLRADGRPGVDGCHLDISKFGKEPIVDGLLIVPESIIATGGTGMKFVDEVHKRGLIQGSTKIVFLAPVSTMKGMKEIRGDRSNVYFLTGRIDKTVTENGYVVPGFGDGGKRKCGA